LAPSAGFASLAEGIAGLDAVDFGSGASMSEGLASGGFDSEDLLTPLASPGFAPGFFLSPG
jgi:hypothetical protein